MSKWKANQLFDFFFHLSPIIFESILDRKFYIHHVQFVKITSQLWNGDLNEDEIKASINSYLHDHTIYYPETDQTSNLHQLKHNDCVFSDKMGHLKIVTLFYLSR